MTFRLFACVALTVALTATDSQAGPFRRWAAARAGGCGQSAPAATCGQAAVASACATGPAVAGPQAPPPPAPAAAVAAPGVAVVAGGCSAGSSACATAGSVCAPAGRTTTRVRTVFRAK